jgi:hypothetical protein
MFECRMFQAALYESGGLADQPAGLMRRMRAAWNVWRAVGDWRQARNKAEWCAQNEGDWKIVQMVIKLREVEREFDSDNSDKGQ